MIALVTDSTACLTPEDARRLNAHVVPHTYTDGSHIYAENYSGENGGFRQLLEEKDCSTVQCSISSFQAAFEGLLQRGYDVLCLVISSRLSGAYSSAKAAALSLFSPAVYRAHSSGRFPHNRRRSPLPFGKSPLPGRSRSFFRKTGPGLRRSPGKGRSGFLCGYDGATSEKRTTGNRAPIGEYNSESKAYPGPAEWSYLLP